MTPSYVDRDRAALREVAAAAKALARSAKIRAGDYASSGGHSVEEDADDLRKALKKWGRVNA